MAYDAADGYILAFGGISSLPYPTADTWIFHNDQWINITSTAGTPPAARFEMGMAYDPADGYVLVFGGNAFTTCPGSTNDLCNDTWIFHAGAWSKLSISAAPPGTWGMGMVYDAADGYVVLFGGDPNVGTWKYIAGTWTEIGSPYNTSYLQPSQRTEFGMTYDAHDDYILLFGGYGINAVLGDTWKFVGGNWTNVTVSPSPMPRQGPAMTFDPVTGNVILFGGFSYIPDPLPPAPLNDTWLFSAGAWTNITSGLAPRARGAAGMVYDSNDSCVLLFGGTEQLGSAGNQNDTWGWCAAPPLVGLVITVSPAVPLPNVAATFAASVRGGVMPFSYFWQFSDGGTSALATPQHTYAAVGDYSVRLWLNDSASHSAHVSRSVRVYVPLAFPSLLANPNPALLGQPVNFTSSESGGTPPYTYAWTFGDGGTGGNLPNITHVYTTNGPFKVELSVTDYLGAVVHAFLNITIELQALVQSTTSSGSAPLVVTFTGGAQGGAPPYTYAWNFGDGTPISTVQNPSHIFAQSGTYPVVLTITDAKGNHASNTILVQVTGGSSLGIAGIELLIGGLGFSAGAAVAVVILAWRRRRSLSSSPEAPKTKVP